MKLLRRLPGRLLAFLSLAFLGGILLTGCETATTQGSFSDVPPPSAPANLGASSEASGLTNAETGRFRVGDMVKVEFAGDPAQLSTHEETIKEDGNITLQLIGPVKAEGKTAGELQKEIHAAYVPRYYVRLTVTVQPKERTYTVGGEVKQSGPKLWFPGTTVVKAIQAGGDFTDFANRRRIKLIRASGKTEIVNYNRAKSRREEDLLVFPGDTIIVERSWW